MGSNKNPAQQAKKKRLLTEEDIDKLEPGMFVALHLDKYPEKPLIAKFLSEREEGTIEVLWYHGTLSGKWKIHKIKKGRCTVENKEVVPRNAVRFFNFTLTPKGKLSTSVKSKLRTVYELGSDLE